MASTGKRLSCLIYLLTFLGSSVLFKRRFEGGFGRNECDMTFMWRQIMLMDVGFKEYNQYSMFLYGEGHYARYFQSTQHLDGIPIIFVPGNAGSDKQVRSIASILQNKTENRNTRFHFDVFAVDFNEEFSGIHSTYLLEHARFVKNAVKHVWSMYPKPPAGIILYGHSLGGVVSRLVLEDEEIRQKVGMVFALASPFKEPPFPIDEKMIRIWERMHSLKTNVPIISIDGGLRDELIDPDWTRSPFALHASSTEIDDVWLETDHQCIVWCNQFVRQNTRFLFDYARAPSKFAGNHVQLFKKHFKNSEQYVKPTKVNANLTFVSVQECNPKCPASGQLKLESNFKQTFVAISGRFASQLTVDGKITGEVQLCGDEKICAFYDGAAGSEAIVDLKGKEAWVLDAKTSEDLKLSPSPSVQQLKFSFVGLKIVNLELPNSLLFYRIRIKSSQPLQRAIFTSEKTKSLAKTRKTSKNQEIIVGLENEDDGNARLYLFGSKDANVEISAELDLWISLVKIMRSIRTYIVPSLIALHLLFVIFGAFGKGSMLLVGAGVFPLSTILQSTPIQLTATMVSVALFYLIVLALNVLISPAFKWLNKKGFSSSLKFQSIAIVAMLLGASQTHPFPFVMMAAIWLVCYFPDAGNLLIWTELFLFTQFPSGFEFFFGLRKYQQTVYAWSLFESPALIFITNCGAFLAFKSTNIRRVFASVYFVSEFFVVFWFLHAKTLTSLIALDSLGLFCVFFMNFEMGAFRQMRKLSKRIR